ncbi:hypothetical protein JSY14_11375 [Brachybacterium sp. EF45031]|uniref:hypothetical protein n=1 Tax=Brachybacterium sillae TaxID=2810536 RepID=UPI00217D346B|nr:hypothetical protein [Brachybacterium sillae]MCS6712590.1 hypothetical protein [Brachybacterium sillae]
MNQDTTGRDIESVGDQSVLDARWISMIDTALRLQAPAAEKYVASLRAKKPGASTEEMMEDVSKVFTNLLTATGAGIGGAAALPGVGTVTAIGLTVGAGVAFAEACAFLALSAAAIHGVDMRDKEARRLVMMGVLGGERGAEIVTKALGKQGVQWETVLAGQLGGSMPPFVRQQVTRYIRRKLLQRTTGVWLGRLLPFGVGAVVGGVGNRAIARSVVEAVEEIFAHAPGTGR